MCHHVNACGSAGGFSQHFPESGAGAWRAGWKEMISHNEFSVCRRNWGCREAGRTQGNVWKGFESGISHLALGGSTFCITTENESPDRLELMCFHISAVWDVSWCYDKEERSAGEMRCGEKGILSTFEIYTSAIMKRKKERKIGG